MTRTRPADRTLRFIILLLARWTCPNNRPTYLTYLMCQIGTAKFFTLLLLLYRTSANGDGFSPLTLAGVTHADKKEAGAALLSICQNMLSPEATQIGSYRGLTLELAFDTFAREYRLTMIGQLRHTVTLGTDVFGNLQRMDNALEGLPIKEQACREQLFNLQTQLETAKAEVQKPFPREEELTTKTARLEELNSLLNLDHKEPEIVDAEPDEDQRPPERRRPQMER